MKKAPGIFCKTKSHCIYIINICLIQSTTGAFELTQETESPVAPAQHGKLIPDWKCEDSEGSCHMPQSSEELSWPVRKKNKKKWKLYFKLTSYVEFNTVLTFSKNIVSVLVLCLLTSWSWTLWSFPIILGFFWKITKWHDKLKHGQIKEWYTSGNMNLPNGQMIQFSNCWM